LPLFAAFGQRDRRVVSAGHLDAQRWYGPALLAAVMRLLFVAYSAAPVKQTTLVRRPPPRPLRQRCDALSESTELAITSGSVSVDTIDAMLVNLDGPTLVTHHRNGHEPGQAQQVFVVTKASFRRSSISRSMRS
jgi:hypothetical protein